jgi:hypothetical protein
MVWAVPRSLAATSGITVLFSVPAGTEMVHFPALSSPAYGFSRGSRGMSLEGLPHSGIFGSKPVCGSPKLFAAYHALHRLLAPRHSPCALSSLTIRTPETDTDVFVFVFVFGRAEHEERTTNTTASVPSNAHCVCVVGKNYRCRVFTCQRTSSVSYS